MFPIYQDSSIFGRDSEPGGAICLVSKDGGKEMQAYTNQTLYMIADENYRMLVHYCELLEQENYWEQPQKILGYSIQDFLELYTGSLLIRLAAELGGIKEQERHFLCFLMKHNLFGISIEQEIPEQIQVQAERILSAPPILLQLCGLRDFEKNTGITGLFFDALLNLMLAGGKLRESQEQKVSVVLKKYYESIQVFLYQGKEGEALLDETYLFYKLCHGDLKENTEGLKKAGENFNWYLEQILQFKPHKTAQTQETEQAGKENIEPEEVQSELEKESIKESEQAADESIKELEKENIESAELVFEETEEANQSSLNFQNEEPEKILKEMNPDDWKEPAKTVISEKSCLKDLTKEEQEEQSECIAAKAQIPENSLSEGFSSQQEEIEFREYMKRKLKAGVFQSRLLEEAGIQFPEQLPVLETKPELDKNEKIEDSESELQKPEIEKAVTEQETDCEHKSKEVWTTGIAEASAGFDAQISENANNPDTKITIPEKEKKESLDQLLLQLNQLVGLEEVKQEIRSLVNLIQIRSLRKQYALPEMEMSYHMIFTGNPGTGKTTVARLVAEIYRELGLLSKGILVETDRSGLVAGYIGQTALKVREVVESAIGGVLFIDEAYSLSGSPGMNDFGSEAIDTLVKLMEDKRDDLVIIAAGYTSEMKGFLKANTGLVSRFNKFIEFQDYSVQELIEILKMMAKQAGFYLEEAAVNIIRNYLETRNLEEAIQFGNARGIRNIFEKLVVNQANRIIGYKTLTVEQLSLITAEDAASWKKEESLEKSKTTKKRTVGRPRKPVENTTSKTGKLPEQWAEIHKLQKA